MKPLSKSSEPSRAVVARRRAATLAVLTVAAGVLVPAAAQGQSLYFTRHFVCDDEPRRIVVQSEPRPASARDELLPLPRRSAPSPLPIAPLLNIDVAVVQPIPVRKSSPLDQPAAPPPVMLASSLDYRCIGYPRGRAGILRVVSAPPGARFHGHGSSESWRLDNMRAAGAFGSRKAIRALRRTVDRPVPDTLEGWARGEQQRVKLGAARALADLGDKASAHRVLAWLRQVEQSEGTVFWKDALDSLPRLSPKLAQAYATVVASRSHRPDQLSDDHHTRLWAVLPLFQARSPKSVTVLRAVSPPLDRVSQDIKRTLLCRVLAARLRAGDDALRQELLPELGASDLRTSRSVTCYSELMPALYPGDDPDEVDVLTHRHRYEAMLTLIHNMLRRERAGDGDPRFATARRKLRAWLKSQSSTPKIAGGDTHRDFSPITRARHLVALAALGDRQARAAIDRTIADPAEKGMAPWIGAHWLLRLDLPGAADVAARRLEIAVHHRSERYRSESWPHRGWQIVTEHVDVIDELAKRRDPRFALGLLDRQRYAREAALHHLARQRPAAACELVGRAALQAEDDAVMDAFWALSVLGDGCRETMARLASESSQPKVVRGMAVEHLAMIRDERVPGLARQAGKRDDLRVFKQRARLIHRSRP